MSLSPCFWKAVPCLCLALGLPLLASAQTPYVPPSGYLTNGGEYAIVGALPGDQVRPAASISATGGYIVWEDNITDGDGQGISIMQLDASMSGQFSSFRVNQQGAGDQERPQVAVLNDGGAVVVWQGGLNGNQRIFARFLSSQGTWLGGDIQVNTFNRNFQANPGVAVLANGNVVVVWGSYNQQGDNSYQDVYGQLLSPAGDKIGDEFLVNQYIPFNQRTPAVAALADGRFVVVWISEQQQRQPQSSPDADFQYNPTNTTASVDVYSRVYAADGKPTGNEMLVNTGLDICANPAVAASSDGGYMVAWGQRDMARTATTTNSWDIFARPFTASGSGGEVRRVNTHTYGDQFIPKIAFAGSEYMVVWSSMGQDGSMEGVFAQVLGLNGLPAGDEFQVNTTWISRQIHPAIAADPRGRFLVTWTGFLGGESSFDLAAQRYMKVSQPLQPMNAPFVYAPFNLVSNVYQPLLEVSWARQSGLDIDHYDLFVDGASDATVSLKTNFWVMTAAQGLTTNSTHTFRVAYVTGSGARSPLSASATGTTWGGLNWGGIAWEWMTKYYGPFSVSFEGPNPVYSWPAATAPVVPGGPTLYQVFVVGGDPTNSSTWLQTQLAGTAQGFFLTWNPQPGRIYQVQSSSSLGSWSNLGGPRIAADTTDSIYVGRSNAGYYRVLLMR